MNFIGVDPGAKGGIAVIRDDGSAELAPFTKENYLRVVSCHKCGVAVVEKVHAMPSQGVTSMFSFGENFGWIQGLLFAFSIPCVLVPPQTWKRHFGLIFPHGTDKNEIKRRSIEKARALFPLANLLPTPRCKKESDGMAEALLMAEYCRRTRDRIFLRHTQSMPY